MQISQAFRKVVFKCYGPLKSIYLQHLVLYCDGEAGTFGIIEWHLILFVVYHVNPKFGNRPLSILQSYMTAYAYLLRFREGF